MEKNQKKQIMLKVNFIYRYKEDDNNKPLCIFMCNTQTKGKILIVPLTSNYTPNVYKLSTVQQYADLDNFKEIQDDNIIQPLYLQSKPVSISQKEAKDIQSYIINSIIHSISEELETNNIFPHMFQDTYQFLKWKHSKFLMRLKPFKHQTTIYENGLYWAHLGVNVGSELNKNRPVLIWKKRCSSDNISNNSYIVFPITSKTKSKKYWYNIPININGRECFIRLEDMRRINIRRITRPIIDENNKNIIFISNHKREEINRAIEKFYVFKNKYNKA